MTATTKKDSGDEVVIGKDRTTPESEQREGMGNEGIRTDGEPNVKSKA